ncbi:Rv2732c family membrane protein [Corynebacterium minutissimum]|uniref:Hypothetical membrane protein n=1 Tax=Corynebacterium minutissimum TaxID=38301 RepID=A0A2X4RBU8_9CORY|nr:hypothetical protein [Corynebacterium minutissimum]KHO28989.1 hypothetical protein NX84_08465 [Corynebacterium minutissimum]MCG7228343.1 hypothetical protein [Corynebacterium minutissimum]MCG7238473.1 hypothetical protein [Corynebacterium minutissimum]QPS59128.1 hypothetical protein I6G51_09505 [Corynebacterium minutissimum]QQA80083.1 hypothetical protein I6H49_03355 [Corynebacterium minutissimum]
MSDDLNAVQDAVAAERRAAKTIELGAHRYALIVSVVLWIAYLLLPYAGEARGWEALMLGTTSEGVKISLVEAISAWLALLGVGVLTTATIVMRRTALALVAWMMTTVSFFANLWGFWYRHSAADGAEIGMYVGALSTFIAFIVYCQVALRRSPEQLAAAERVREVSGQLDHVGVLQSEAATDVPAEENPLLIDNRRSQAASRHRRQQEDSDDN